MRVKYKGRHVFTSTKIILSESNQGPMNSFANGAGSGVAKPGPINISNNFFIHYVLYNVRVHVPQILMHGPWLLTVDSVVRLVANVLFLIRFNGSKRILRRPRRVMKHMRTAVPSLSRRPKFCVPLHPAL